MAEDRPERFPYPFPLPADLLDDPADGDVDKEGVSPFAMANHLLRHARWVILLPLLAFGVTAFYISLQDEYYLAESRFLPAKAEFGGGGGGMVSQLNRLVGGATSNSADGMFYSFLAQSSAFLRQAARSEFEFTRTTDSGEPETVRGSLAEIHGLSPSDEEANMRASLGILRPMVNSRVEPGTGFVVISVTSEWPGLAVAVNDRLLELINAFNLDQRQSQAASERQFVEARMAAAREELEQVQAQLVTFLEQNQRYDQSPRLRYEALRLESDVEMKRALYSSLVQSYEQARISEVRNTPVVTVVERPEETVYLPRRGKAPVRYGAMAFIVVALLTIGLIAARAYLARQSEEHPDDFEEFRRLARDTVPLPQRLRKRLAAWGDRGNGGGPGVTARSSGSSDH